MWERSINGLPFAWALNRYWTLNLLVHRTTLQPTEPPSQACYLYFFYFPEICPGFQTAGGKNVSNELPLFWIKLIKQGKVVIPLAECQETDSVTEAISLAKKWYFMNFNHLQYVSMKTNYPTMIALLNIVLFFCYSNY